MLLQLETELDEESDDNVTQHEENPENPGVDDGLLIGNRDAHDDDENHKFNPSRTNSIPHDAAFPYAPGFDPNVVWLHLLSYFVIVPEIFVLVLHL